MFVIPYPAIDPTLVSIGPFAVRWYALAYIAALLLGWRYCLFLARRWNAQGSPTAGTKDIDDFLVWATLAVILGGRIGYVLFYNREVYFENPSQIVALWHGGMSYHGGIAGVTLATYLFCRQRKLSLLRFADLIGCAAPIGLFLGRIANFINGELWGRVTDVPWAMVFPSGGPEPRHPSQLYEGFLEGFVLFFVLFFLQRSPAIRARPGALTGVFFIGYSLARIFSEFFREPDAQLGFIFAGVTMGQILSLPVLAAGLLLLLRAKRQPAAA